MSTSVLSAFATPIISAVVTVLGEITFSGPSPGIAEEEHELLLPSELSPRIEVAVHWQPHRR